MASSNDESARIRLMQPREAGDDRAGSVPEDVDQLARVLSQDSAHAWVYPFLFLLILSVAEEHDEIQRSYPHIALDLVATSAVRIYSTPSEVGAAVVMSVGFLAQLVDICIQSSLLMESATDIDGFANPLDEELWTEASDTSRWLLRGLRWARCATFLAYYHEVAHVALQHADYVARITGEATPDDWRSGQALISAQQAFEAEADKEAITMLLIKQEQITIADGVHDLGATLALAGFALHMLAELIARMDFNLDGADLFRSRLGAYDEDRVHPGIAQRRFQAISHVFRMAESPEVGRAAETAVTCGAGLAANCLSALMEADRSTSLSESDRRGVFLTAGQDADSVSGYYAYTLELEGRLEWMRQRGELEELFDDDRLVIHQTEGAL
jgi:hypothetical protein